MQKKLARWLAAAQRPAGMLGASAALVLGLGSAAAHQQGPKLHLADAPSDQQVEAITYCNNIYRVTTKARTPVEYPEFDLRFKTDGGPNGPAPGTAVLINAGMRGDRGFVVFSTPDRISSFIESKC